MPPEETIVTETAATGAESTTPPKRGRKAPAATGAESTSAATKGKPDLRTAGEKALTSHLDRFNLLGASAESEESGESAEAPKLKLPSDPAKVIELLQKTQAEPVANKAEAKIKQAKLDQIRAHLHEIQQGTPPPALDHKSHAAHASATSDHAKEFKLIMLAREHVEVRELISERDDLLKQVSELTKK